MAPKKKTDSSAELKGAQTRTTRVNSAGKPAERRHPGKRSEEVARSLQHQAFLLNVAGFSCREIAARLGITGETASKYIREETSRRRESLQRDRDDQAAEAVAFYDEVATLGIELAKQSTKAFMQPLIKGLDAAVKARERKDKILGLDAPVKVDMGLQDLVNAIDANRPE